MNASAIVCLEALAFGSISRKKLPIPLSADGNGRKQRFMKETDRLNQIYKFPQQILRNPQLTSSDKIVAFHLFRFINKDGIATMPKIKDMVECLKISTRMVKLAKANLIANNILSVEGDTYRILLAGQISYSTSDFHSKETMNMMGNFVKAPLYTLYANGLTSLQKICLMIFFDYFFEGNNGKYIRKRDIKLTSLHNLYKDMFSYDRLKKNLEAVKEAGWIDWKVVKSSESGEMQNKVVGSKVYKSTTKVVPYNEQEKEQEKKLEEQEELDNIEEQVIDMITDETKLTAEEIEKCMDIVNPALARKFKTIVAKWSKQEALKWLANNKRKG